MVKKRFYRKSNIKEIDSGKIRKLYYNRNKKCGREIKLEKTKVKEYNLKKILVKMRENTNRRILKNHSFILLNEFLNLFKN